MVRWLLKGTEVTFPGRLVVVVMLASAVLGAVVADMAESARSARVVKIITVEPAHVWDLANPWERCLAAMEEAEIPGDMWECYEYPRERP